MSLGESTVSIVAGGGQQRASAATVAKTIVQLGVSPAGTVNQLYGLSAFSSIQSTFDSGPLAEAVAMRHRAGITSYAVPLNPSTAGGVSASVTQVGTGSGTITPSVAPHKLIELLCVLGGAVGTFTFKYRLNGGAYSDTITSAATYRIPGTFCTLSFAAATYVATKTLSVAVDGTVTAGSGWVGTVTQASSPIDAYDVRIEVVKAGALGTAVLKISLDGGLTPLPDMVVPSGGVIVVPGTGLVLTCANTFVAGDVYTFNAHPPTYSTNDLTNAINVLTADQTLQSAMIHVVGLPGSASSAISQASSLDTLLLSALSSYNRDWQGMCECPVVGDITLSGGAAVVDSADTDSTIRTARAGQDLIRTALCAGTHRMTSPLTGRKVKRPYGVALAARFSDTEPKDSLSALEPRGPLPIYAIGRDEATATTGLDDVQINVARTYLGRNGVFQSITAGGFGFKNLTTQAAYQDAEGVRALNLGVQAVRVAGLALLGQRPPVNADGTITEKQAKKWDALLDGVIKRALGLLPGGDFTSPQVSAATATVKRTSQLGASPHRLDIEYTIQTLGFVSQVSSTVNYSGTVTLEG